MKKLHNLFESFPGQHNRTVSVLFCTLAVLPAGIVAANIDSASPEVDACGSMGYGQGPVGDNLRTPECLRLLGVTIPTDQEGSPRYRLLTTQSRSTP